MRRRRFKQISPLDQRLSEDAQRLRKEAKALRLVTSARC
jgi:hypothetical protein